MTESAEDLRKSVRDTYGRIANSPREQNQSSCCGAGACSESESSFMMSGENYASMPGYNPDADLGLGCGIPTQFSRIKKGDTVVDLGSGAGNDVFVARAQTGETGRVIGVDMTEPMLLKARANNEKLGFKNVEFVQGEIENLPLADATADVVISNCVLNLVPEKKKAFAEIFRILKPGGQFTISDIVLQGELHENLRGAAVMYAGCVAGALEKNDYLGIILESGFQNLSLLKEKTIIIPDDVLAGYLTPEQLSAYKSSGPIIKSVTVTAVKPAKTKFIAPWEDSFAEASACCGGPAQSNVNACCVLDEEAKEAGKSGCGCN